MFDLSATLFPDPPLHDRRPGPDAPLQQSGVFARAVTMLGGRADCVDFAGHAAWAVTRKLPLLGPVSMVSRGPADLTPDAARVMRAVTGARHLIVNAEHAGAAGALAGAGFWRIARARRIAELYLDPDPDIMAARMTAKWRNRLRHGLRQGVRVTSTPLPPTPRHWLFAAEALSARTLGYRPMSPAIIAAIAAARPGTARLFVARKTGGPVAAMLFLRHGRCATYQIGWSTRAGRACSAGNLLLWRAMIELGAAGCDRIDLGLADPEQDPGLARFKRGSGALLRPLGGTWLASALLPDRARGMLRVSGLHMASRKCAAPLAGPPR